MKIETKFEIGDMIYPIALAAVYAAVDCPFCGGYKDIIGEDETSISCPKCGGTGTVSKRTHKEAWRLAADAPVSIRYVQVCNVQETKDTFAQSIDYACGPHPYVMIWKEMYSFATEEEAQAECDRRNNK